MENKTEQFLSKSAVREMTALSDATLKRLKIAGDFPARRLVAECRVAWLASEVTE
jgi:predicted DNA-binding transcriptional regulator AlpA